ncbi:hypothetical protein A9P82_06190 [Arachidicoccus ginsenosidimutans]|nr:hypothetical protein A9P82_06190 [Arachidicoccus sp. BS20]
MRKRKKNYNWLLCEADDASHDYSVTSWRQSLRSNIIKMRSEDASHSKFIFMSLLQPQQFSLWFLFTFVLLNLFYGTYG